MCVITFSVIRADGVRKYNEFVAEIIYIRAGYGWCKCAAWKIKTSTKMVLLRRMKLALKNEPGGGL